MNNAWFFGDSFTAGEGFNFEQFSDSSSVNYNPNINSDTKNQYDIWPYLVSRELNFTCNNKGENASSNQQILNRLLRNLKNFKKGDLVVVGYTVPYRLLIPTPNKEIPMKTCLIESLYRHNDIVDKDSIKQYGFDDRLNDIEKNSIIDYLYHIVHQYDESIEIHEKKTYRELFKFLNNLGIKTLFWDYTHWHNYETIEESTFGKIKDRHWSLKGHSDFSKLVIYSVNNNRFELERQNKNSVFNKFKKNLVI